MAEYQMKEDEINIFKNKDKKETKHPDFKGKIMIDGEVRDVALWVKESKKGEKYFSGKHSKPFKKQDDQEQKAQPAKNQQVDDDLPF
jgi:uncharacterized protein (DUF736 family)